MPRSDTETTSGTSDLPSGYESPVEVIEVAGQDDEQVSAPESGQSRIDGSQVLLVAVVIGAVIVLRGGSDGPAE